MTEIEQLRFEVRQLLGEVCRHCGRTPIEYAHVAATKLHGRGRGASRRYRDILKFPDRYIPLCRTCHQKYDAK